MSTAHVTCAAQALEGEQRQRVALQVLPRSAPVTALAARHQVSRTFRYPHAAKGTQALEPALQPLAPRDHDGLCYLPVTTAWLRQVVLGRVLLCHRSCRGVSGFVRDRLDQPLALGTVHHIVAEAGLEARRLNARQDLAPLRAGSHDELFQGHPPGLGGIALACPECYRRAREAHRAAATWAIPLGELAEHGLQPDDIGADGGQGFRAGQAWAWPVGPGDGDGFHGLQPVTRLVATLQKRASAAIARRAELEQKMQPAHQRGQGRPLSKPRARARAQETTAMRRADEVQPLAGWLQHDLLALVGTDTATRQARYDFGGAARQARDAVEANRLRPVRRALAHQRDTRLAFPPRLDQPLEARAQPFTVPTAGVRARLALHSRPPTPTAYGATATAWHQRLHHRFCPLQQALAGLRHRFHRASSLVQNRNSRLRPYCFLRRQLGPTSLELLRCFLNHQPCSRSQNPERRRKSPTALLTGQAHPHWLEMRGFTRFTRARGAA